jgi:hypothetical protein
LSVTESKREAQRNLKLVLAKIDRPRIIRGLPTTKVAEQSSLKSEIK